MSTNDLEQAIMLIQQSNMTKAQSMLEEILSADPNNLTAWSWYVKTSQRGEMRLKAF